jgi:hypothetical protein
MCRLCAPTRAWRSAWSTPPPTGPSTPMRWCPPCKTATWCCGSPTLSCVTCVRAMARTPACTPPIWPSAPTPTAGWTGNKPRSTAPAVPPFVQWVRTPEAQRQPAVIAKSVADTEPLFTLLDAHLAQQPLHGGRCPHHGRHTAGVRGAPLGQPAPTTPPWSHLMRWYTGLLALPGSRGVLDQALS